LRASLEIIIDRRERIDCQDRRQAGPERVVIGIEGNRTSVTGESLIQLLQIVERSAQVTVHLGGIWFDGEGLLVACHGLIQLPQALERMPKVTVRLGVIGFEGKGFRDEINGGVVFSHI
jgi:hypothetical protein